MQATTKEQMTEWIARLTGALEQHGNSGAMMMTLATVSRRGGPRARTVVCRGIDSDGTIWLVSDGRSAKNRQIKLDPRVEVVVWLPDVKLQYRLRGKATVFGPANQRALELWRKLSDATRATFCWPSPGKPRKESDELFKESVASDTPPPMSFQAIAIFPTRVEELDLNPHPHRRQRWRKKKEWAGEEINP